MDNKLKMRRLKIFQMKNLHKTTLFQLVKILMNLNKIKLKLMKNHIYKIIDFGHLIIHQHSLIFKLIIKILILKIIINQKNI